MEELKIGDIREIELHGKWGRWRVIVIKEPPEVPETTWIFRHIEHDIEWQMTRQYVEELTRIPER